MITILLLIFATICFAATLLLWACLLLAARADAELPAPRASK
jgi:hypothetical protein